VSTQRGSQDYEVELPGVAARSRDGGRLVAQPPPPEEVTRDELEERCATLIDSMRPGNWPNANDDEGPRG
jgi:hypothetical protein